MASGYQPRNSMNFIGLLGNPGHLVAGLNHTGRVSADGATK